jgi:hypothetical protein
MQEFLKGIQMSLMVNHVLESVINTKDPFNLTFQNSKLDFSGKKLVIKSISFP